MSTQRPPRLLFVSPDASRSGAPIVLLHLLRWLRANTTWQLEVLLLRGGPLQAEYSEVAHAVHTSRAFSFLKNAFAANATLSGTALGGAASQFSGAKNLLQKGATPALQMARNLARRDFIARENYDLIYANTVAAGAVLRVLSPNGKRNKTPILSHIHEMDYAMMRLRAATHETLRLSTHLIACSGAVEKTLTARGVSDERISVVHSFVETQRAADGALKTQMRARLGLPDDAFVVMSGGAMEWRKGCDLWLQSARRALQKRDASARDEDKPEMRFVWIGSAADALYETELRHDIRRMGLENICIITGAMPDARDGFAAGDIFFLPSREDPFPLVALEAAALGLPLVCFENAGGTTELVEKDAGFIAPYADCESAARLIFALMRNRYERYARGHRAAEKAAMMADVSVGAPRIQEIIERIIHP